MTAVAGKRKQRRSVRGVAPRSAHRDPLRAEDWIDAAVRAMLRGSTSDVKVDRLARELKVSRGSFYWHFRNRAALLNAVLKHWENQTLQINSVLARHDPDPQQRLLRLLLLPDDGETRIPASEFESAVRSWARSSAQARAVTERVDALRAATMQQLVTDLGAPAARAPALAWVLSAVTGWLWFRYQMNHRLRHEVITEFFPMLLQAIRQPAKRR
jgi:AcrR family transcriptional regulator